MFDLKQLLQGIMPICLAVVVVSGANFAQAFSPEIETLDLKGYSPETIEIVMANRSRNEWRGMATRKRTPSEKFWYNFIHGEWVGDLDEPGYQIIRRN
jgi:hypothetical protein